MGSCTGPALWHCHTHVPSWCGFCAWELWYLGYAIPVCMCWLARWTDVPRRSTVLMWVGKWPGCIVLPKGKGQGVFSLGVKLAIFQYGDPADWMKRGVDCMHHETPTQITINKKYRHCHTWCMAQQTGTYVNFHFATDKLMLLGSNLILK